MTTFYKSLPAGLTMEDEAYVSPTSMLTSNSRYALRFRKQRSMDRVSQGSYNHYVWLAETTKINLRQVCKFWSDLLRHQSTMASVAESLKRPRANSRHPTPNPQHTADLT
jgi:hypothetical protein